MPRRTTPASSGAPDGSPWSGLLDRLLARAQGLLAARSDTSAEVPRVPAASSFPDSLAILSDTLPLGELDLTLLLIAAAPALDPRFEAVYAALNDERDSRGPSGATALQLAGASLLDGDARGHLHPGAPLSALGLIDAGPARRSLLARILVVPESVTGYLLGTWLPDPVLERALVLPERPPLSGHLLPDVEWPDDSAIVVRARAGTAVLDHVRLGSFAAVDAEPMIVDGSLLDLDDANRKAVLRACVRDVALLGTTLAIDLRGCSADIPAEEIAAFMEHLDVPCVIIVDARRPLGSRSRTAVTLPLPSLEQRLRWWEELAPDADHTLAITATHLEPEDIIMAGRTGQSAALSRVKGSARRSRVQLVVPELVLDDVITDDAVAAQLRDLADRVRYRSIVLDEWRMRPGGGRGRGVAALFAGESGTGKSMSAEALAGELGVPLFKVELASVVDKYIGETEKNLEDVFRAVENDDGVLLFDEADALFGKRSGVSDARDRYANIEVAYLLQRIEAFEGLAILTTNMRANLDEAFQRRLDLIIEFPAPNLTARERIWRQALSPFPDALNDSEFATLAALEFTGGYIRAAAITAAYKAASQDSSVSRRHVLAGARDEWRKSGRLNFPAHAFSDWSGDVS